MDLLTGKLHGSGSAAEMEDKCSRPLVMVLAGLGGRLRDVTQR